MVLRQSAKETASASIVSASSRTVLSGKRLKAFWNEVWSTSGPSAFSDTISCFISSKELENKKVLDVGCGNLGMGSSMFLLDNAGSYAGVDISDVAIEKARLFYPDVTFIVADAQNLPFQDRTFDLTVSYMTAELLGSGYRKALSEIARVSNEGIILEFPHYEWIKQFKHDNPLQSEDGVIITCDKHGIEHVGLDENKLRSMLTEFGLVRQELQVFTYRDRETMIWHGARTFYAEEFPVLDVKNQIFVKAFRE